MMPIISLFSSLSSRPSSYPISPLPPLLGPLIRCSVTRKGCVYGGCPYVLWIFAVSLQAPPAAQTREIP